MITASGLSRGTENLLALSPSNAACTVTQYTYDKFGNISCEKTYNGQKSYTYDFAGNVLTTEEPNGVTTYNTYDSRGNLMTSTAGSDVISYTYNSFGLCTCAYRNGEGSSYTYDNFGRVTTETQGTKTLSRTYNTNGQTVSFALAEGSEVLQSAQYAYDVLGNMISASNGGDSVEYTYNANSLPLRENRGYLVTDYEYTAGNLIKSARNCRRAVKNPESDRYNTLYDVSAFEYTYYPDGNVASVSDERGTAASLTEYTYDCAGRLTGAQITSNGAAVRSWQYAYNINGDMTSKVETAGESTTTALYTYTNHRLTSERINGEATEYRYDANGNTLAKLNDSGTVNYTYTPRNEVASVTFGGNKSGTYSYTYDASSLRTSRTDGTNTTYFTWSGSNIVRETAADKSTEYFYGVNRVSRTIRGTHYSGTVYNSETDEEEEVNSFREFYLYDGRGNAVQLADPEVQTHFNIAFGKASDYYPELELSSPGVIDIDDLTAASSPSPVTRSYYYSPYGEIWQGESDYDTNPFRYSGEYYDKETGSIYLRARYYSPSIGRFLTVDPIKDGTNWYVYCGNNPIAFVDPSGKCHYCKGIWTHDKWESPKDYKEPWDLYSYIDVDVNIGVGLGITCTINGVVTIDASLNAKYDLTDMFTDNPTLTANAGISVSVLDAAEIGISTETSQNAMTGELIENDTFVGVKVGSVVFAIYDNSQYAFADAKDDVILSFSIEAYLAVGGGVSVEFNLSEYQRQQRYKAQQKKE